MERAQLARRLEAVGDTASGPAPRAAALEAVRARPTEEVVELRARAAAEAAAPELRHVNHAAVKEHEALGGQQQSFATALADAKEEARVCTAAMQDLARQQQERLTETCTAVRAEFARVFPALAGDPSAVGDLE